MVFILLLFARIARAASVVPMMPNMVMMSMTMPAVQSAIDSATRRNNRIFVAYMVVLVVTALIISLFTYLVWDAGNKVQDAVQGEATARIDEAMQKVAEANQKAKDLDAINLVLSGQVAGLQENAADAQAAQQRVEIELSKQREKTAKAEMALEELKEAARPRELTPKQTEQLIKNLKPLLKTPVRIEFVGGAPEPKEYASQIAGVFLASGWTGEDVSLIDKFFDSDPTGVGFTVKNMRFQSLALRKIQTAFFASGLPLAVLQDDGTNSEGITIVVGLKPTPHPKAD